MIISKNVLNYFKRTHYKKKKKHTKNYSHSIISPICTHSICYHLSDKHCTLH